MGERRYALQWKVPGQRRLLYQSLESFTFPYLRRCVRSYKLALGFDNSLFLTKKNTLSSADGLTKALGRLKTPLIDKTK